MSSIIWTSSLSKPTGKTDTTNPFFESLELGRSKRIGLANNGNNVDTGGETAHKLNIHFPEGVASRGDEVEKSMDSVFAEAGVTLDAGFLCENVIVLPLKVPHDFAEASAW
jgi:hypothetical protein